MIHEVRLTITLTPRVALFALMTAFIVSVPNELGSETMTMTTTYPSPVGIYRTIITTGKTDLARDIAGATVTVGQNGGATLSVNGNITDAGNISATGGAGSGNISASGNISSGGLISGNSANITNGIIGGSLTVNGSSTLRNTEITSPNTLQIDSTTGLKIAGGAANQILIWTTGGVAQWGPVPQSSGSGNSGGGVSGGLYGYCSTPGVPGDAYKSGCYAYPPALCGSGDQGQCQCPSGYAKVTLDITGGGTASCYKS